MKKITWLGAAVALIGALIAPVQASAAKPNFKALTGSVYFMLPNTTTARFTEHDGPEFVKAMKRLAPKMKVVVVNANNNGATQIQQAETAIAKGAKALVFVAADPNTAGGFISKAVAAKIPVIDYEHGVSNPGITYHVQNSPLKVGEGIGKTAAAALKAMTGTIRVARIYGNKGDDYTTQEKLGQDNYLQPLIDSGKIKVVCEDYTANWQPSVAQVSAEQCLTKTQNGVDVFIAMNDGTAMAAVAAIQGQKLIDTIKVYGGQDAGLDALKYLLRGWIQDDVYKPFNAEATVAAQLTLAAITKTAPPKGLITGKFSDGKPIAFLDVIDLTGKTIGKVVEDGLYKKSELYTSDVVDVTGYCK